MKQKLKILRGDMKSWNMKVYEKIELLEKLVDPLDKCIESDVVYCFKVRVSNP